MNNKRFLLILLLSTLFMVIVSGFVSAGCCLMPNEGQSCMNTSNPGVDCPAPDQEYVNDSCYAREECAIGCCCPTGIGSTNYSCPLPRTFIKDSSANLGSFCSCGGPSYTISGTVRDSLNNPLSGATVSARGISNVSLSNGRYILNRVPSGTQIEVAARKNGCLSATTTIDLNSNRDPVDISLNCVCAAGSCDAVAHAFCTSTNNWREYNLAVESAAYCILCRNSDTVNCQQASLCQGGDGACPLSCSNIQGSTNFDSDCVCGMTSNGVCPAPSFGCDIYNDADCITLNPVCGNGIIEYPYETCDYGPPVIEGQLSICSFSECSACNCRGLSRCGNLILNAGEACEIGMMCANGSMCENCQCEASLCSPTNLNPASNLNPKLNANFDYANQRMFVNWSVPNACRPSVGYYSLFKCKGCNAQSNLGDFNPLNLIIGPTTFNYSDRLIEGNSTYCYYVRASYMDGRPDGVSAVVCNSTGADFCINPHTREFCLNNDRYNCTSRNTLNLIKDCSPGYCMPPDYSGITRCVNQSVCDYCNGLYGMFANLPGLKVRINGTTSFTFNWCNSTNPAIPAVEGCYYDRTRTLFSAFKYCSNVSSCYNYKSKTACEDPDSCGGKTGPCVWNWTQRTKPELGGLCRPFDENDQQCELCDSKEFNWLSPSCTPEICKLFGNCYYIGKGTWHDYSCSSEKLLTCADYNDSNRCAGGQPVRVDVNYDPNGNRISGTHQLTPSNDNLDLGKCYWHDYNNGYGLCIRDADGFPVVSFAPGAPGWDCDSNDIICSSDFDNPITTILPRSGCNAGGIYGETADINYVVSDDRYFSRYLKTYFCITSQGSTCYPSNLGFNGTYTRAMTASGMYKLFYYSQDPAKNLEVIKSITIEVDAAPPIWGLTNPSMVCNLQTSQPTLLLEGVVSSDAAYICARNRQNNKVVCQNNCVFNNTPPCISSSGLFTLNVPITVNSALANITVYAQDRACNYFENTILAACHNNTFPRLRINISHYYTNLLYWTTPN